ncbi:MAG: YegS/Rv2252/BmrU family lipid kinase [Oscillospiraceae bacterium]
MGEKLLYIINPRSGKAEIKNHLLFAIDTFIKGGFDVSVRTTQSKGDAMDFVKMHGEGFDRIVVSGGDGTVNEVLNGIMTLKKKPTLGVVPAGTTNDYAYSLGIPGNMQQAAEIAAAGMPFPIDVGLFNDRYFTYVAGFGALTEVTYKTPQDAKNVLGRTAYILEGIKRLSSIKYSHIRLEYDGGVIENDYIIGLFTNSVSIAGFRNALGGSKLDDGLLEITLIKMPTKLEEIQTIINVLMDIEQTRGVHTDFLTFLTTSKVRVVSGEPMEWTIDGEGTGAVKDVTIKNCHRVLSVLRSPDAATL